MMTNDDREQSDARPASTTPRHTHRTVPRIDSAGPDDTKCHVDSGRHSGAFQAAKSGIVKSNDLRFRCPACHSWRYRAADPCPNCGLGDAVPATSGDLAPLRRLFADLAWDEAAASCRLDYDQTTDEITEDVCRELRAAGLDPERMQRRVREIIDRVAEERRAR